jgi:peptide chain release factor 2
MLLRMYVRFSEEAGFEAEILDLQEAEEAGLKSATFLVAGENAYGYLKSERGVHRLVRISPFDTNKRRHTSFASVSVYPEIEDDIAVEIDEKDLRVDTFRASGKGGQHINKTDSAVRITHIPTGIVVQCQNERSQFKNKAMALKILKSRLYDMLKKEQEAKLLSYSQGQKEATFGSQIRSYVLQPYQLVKDHRTGLETSDVQAVLDGQVFPFIKKALLARVGG